MVTGVFVFSKYRASFGHSGAHDESLQLPGPNVFVCDVIPSGRFPVSEKFSLVGEEGAFDQCMSGGVGLSVKLAEGGFA